MIHLPRPDRVTLSPARRWIRPGHKVRPRITRGVAGTAILAAVGASASAADFQGLGDLPNFTFGSRATAVSADGRVVVGQGDLGSGVEEAFRWEGGVMIPLGDFPSGSFESQAFGISPDGSVIVGVGRTALGPEAFRWEADVMVGLGDFPGGDDHELNSVAYAVSVDGTVIVGQGEGDANADLPVRWDNGVLTSVDPLPRIPNVFGEARAVSADGKVIVGYDGIFLLNQEAFRWEAGVMSGLGDLPGGGTPVASPMRSPLTGWLW